LVWEKKHQKKVGFADDSINGHTEDLQIDNFLEWGPDHQEFVREVKARIRQRKHQFLQFSL